MPDPTTAPLRDSRGSNAPRRFFPLYGKILLWFFANVLLVGGAAVWMVREQFGLDRTLLLTRDGRARLQVRAEQTLEAVATTGADRATADAVLAQLGEDERMTFALVDFAGTIVAGQALALPPLVRERIATGRFRGGPPGRGAEGAPPGRGIDGAPPGPGEGGTPPGPPQGMAPSPGLRDGFPGRPADEAAGRREREGGGGFRGQRAWREGVRQGEFPKEALRTENPTRYWLIARLPPLPEGPGRGRPLALVGMAESLGQSELLFNPRPWIIGSLGLLGASAMLWWPFVRGLTRSLAQMRGATERVARGDFSVRVDDSRGDELGRLGTAVNAMTGRLEGFVSGQKRFLGDIAHELCSPLARMEMGLGILDQRTPPELRERVGDVRDEVREMSTLVNELLAFSKAGLQDTATAREPVALAPLIQAVAVREADGLPVVLDVPAELSVLAAPSLLVRAVANILRNTRRYAGTAGPIEITARHANDTDPPHAGQIILTIADHGPGVPAAMLPRLFDPFFRVDPARTRETGGVGLGLAIVKSCVEACGGSATARARPDGATGLVIDLRLEAVEGTNRTAPQGTR